MAIGSKKIILLGVLDPGQISDEIIQNWANDPSVIVLTEVTSNIRHPKFINSIDSLITSFSDEDFKALQADILITMGGMVVSKRIKKFFRTFKPTQHWHIDPLRAYDTFNALTHHIEITPNEFFSVVNTQNQSSLYQEATLNTYKLLRNKQDEFVHQAPYSDLKLFEAVFNKIPNHTLLHISNSSAIRYAQLFDIDPSLQIFCNRGTSGIDGCTSTAIGAAVKSKLPTVLITGDVSFLYDSNALWNANTPGNFKIIILNNGGGGIFRILPGHQDTPVFNTFFETEHNYTAKHLAAMYGYNYSTCESLEQLEKLNNFFNSNTKEILEVFTPTKLNNQVLKDYFNYV